MHPPTNVPPPCLPCRFFGTFEFQWIGSKRQLTDWDEVGHGGLLGFMLRQDYPRVACYTLSRLPYHAYRQLSWRWPCLLVSSGTLSLSF